MKLKLLLLGSLTFLGIGLLAQDRWVKKADFGGGARGGAFQFSIGNKGYIGTGADNSGTYKNDFWEFDPATGIWSQKADYGGGIRAFASSFVIGNYGYAGTGVVASYDWRKDMWKYDPVSNTWSQIADFGGGLRYTAVGFAIGGKGYMGTGNYRESPAVPATYYNDFWEYNPSTDIWTQKANVPEQGRTNAVGMSIGNKGYIGTGFYYYDTRKKDFWEYDPATDVWTRKADFPATERFDAGAFSIGSKGYVGTGWYYSGFNDLWEFNPATDNWNQMTSLPADARVESSFFSIGNKGYVGIGSSASGYLGDFWEYTPPTCESWTAMPLFPDIGRYGSVAIGLGSKGYIGTGASDNGYYTDFWEFDPASKTWTQKADFPGGARQAGVAFGINGKAYVGTGITSPYILFNDLYEYTPSTNTWVKKADYPGGGRYTSMAFSIGDKGYVGAGKDYGFTYGTNDFYEYNPATDSWTQKANIGSVRRSAGIGFSIGNRGYIGMGLQDYDTRLKDLWEYDPTTDTWIQKADLPATERYAPMAFTLGDKGYVGGGYYYSGFNDLWAYSPVTNSWEQKASMPSDGGAQGIGLTIGNKGYIGFGYSNNITFNVLWEYSSGMELKAPPVQMICYDVTNSYTILLPEIKSACTMLSSQFTITGATSRSGNGLNASGLFNPGTSYIRWTILDNSGNSAECETRIIINPPLNVSIPNTYPLLIWGEPNTLYLGFGPTNLTLFAIASGGTKLPGNKYSYAWSTGATTPYINVTPGTAGTHNYTVTVTDSLGCSITTNKTITVIDVRCGQALNKVIICRPSKNGNNEFCVTQSQAVVSLLLGAHLGNCNPAYSPNKTFGKVMEENIDKKVSVFPNPNNGTFTVTLANIDASEVRIIDQNGKIISQKKIQGSVKTNTLSFQLPTVAKGMYMIQAISKEGIFTCKMMVQQ